MMNYSDYDSEDYSSNEDEDYVPSDDNLSEDDLNECEKEDDLDAEDQRQAPSEQVTKKKKSSKGLSARKRKKGGLKLEGDDDGGTFKQKEEELNLPEEKSVAESTTDKGHEQKKKADDLWASFLSDVGQRPKAEAPASGQITAVSDEVSKSSAESSQKEPNATEASKITITKVYDFAGEEVRVTKEVDADSREAKTFLKKEEKEGVQQTSVCKASAESSLTAGPRYLERKNFLERVDQRQFELEKNVRLSNMKR
ncbi:craniofacial development protein 1 isoform X2 [Hemibagrus wyckioides]|uniref:craniofacial development protein 1 isoform X2 n=1 Tax=Hemibagrus wyckioides TaxID=337641 RepID=UPI00266CD8C7|nr:craniofacial development protein 1 isoform X2 [Hemibagrus wyckioides]